MTENIKVVNFTGGLKDLSLLGEQIKEVIYSQDYEINIAEIIGLLEIIKLELYEDTFDD